MPSFVCDYCQNSLKKAQLDKHKSHCRNAVFSCIDCGNTFAGVSYREHTSCITEVQKYQKHLAKGKKNGNQQPPQQNGKEQQQQKCKADEEEKAETTQAAKKPKSEDNTAKPAAATSTASAKTAASDSDSASSDTESESETSAKETTPAKAADAKQAGSEGWQAALKAENYATALRLLLADAAKDLKPGKAVSLKKFEKGIVDRMVAEGNSKQGRASLRRLARKHIKVSVKDGAATLSA